MNNDWLDNALKHDDRYLDDAGFTARVVGTLPAKSRRKWLRPVIIGGAFAAGMALAVTLLPSESYLVTEFVRLLRARSLSAIPLMPVVLIVAMFWTTIAAAASER